MRLSKPEAGGSDFKIQSLKNLKPWMWLDSTSFEGDTSKQGAIVEAKDVVCICPMAIINFFSILYFVKNTTAVLSLQKNFCCSVQRDSQQN